MPEHSIIKLKARRGTDEQRKKVILDQGELGYTTDTARLFVGTGALSGGKVVGAKIHPPILSEANLVNVNAQVGDQIVANNLTFQLTAVDYTSLVSWRDVSSVVDDTTIEYSGSNSIQVKDSGITAVKLDASTVTGGLSAGSVLQIAYDTSQFQILSGYLNLISGSISETELASTSFGNGLEGGSGTVVSVKAGSGFGFDGTGTLQLTAYPSQSVSISSIDPAMIGAGLAIDDQQLIANLTDVDAISIQRDPTNGEISLTTNGTLSGFSVELPYVNYNEFGIPVNIETSIYETLTGVGATGFSDTPIGAILPHAAAFGNIPSGYLLCDGTNYLKSDYPDLENIIGVTYGGSNGLNFNVPDLTEQTILHGMPTTPDDSVSVDVAGVAHGAHSATTLHSVETNYVIKATSIVNNIFNGFPGQVSLSSNGASVVEYETLDASGATVMLSSAGFITFEGDVQARNTGAQVDRFAIPVFTY